MIARNLGKVKENCYAVSKQFKSKKMQIIIAILALTYLISCGIILYHTIQSFDVKYKNNVELQSAFVKKMKKHFKFNLTILAGTIIANIFYKIM